MVRLSSREMIKFRLVLPSFCPIDAHDFFSAAGEGVEPRFKAVVLEFRLIELPDFRHAIDNCLHELTTTANAELHSLLTLNFQFFSKSDTPGKAGGL